MLHSRGNERVCGKCGALLPLWMWYGHWLVEHGEDKGTAPQFNTGLELKPKEMENGGQV